MIRHTLKSEMPTEHMPAQAKVAEAKSLPVRSIQLSRRRAGRMAKATHRDTLRRDRNGVKIMPAKGLITKVVTQGKIGIMTAIQPWRMPAFRGKSCRFVRDPLGQGSELGNCRHMMSGTSLTEYSCQVSLRSRAHLAQSALDSV